MRTRSHALVAPVVLACRRSGDGVRGRRAAPSAGPRRRRAAPRRRRPLASPPAAPSSQRILDAGRGRAHRPSAPAAAARGQGQHERGRGAGRPGTLPAAAAGHGNGVATRARPGNFAPRPGAHPVEHRDSGLDDHAGGQQLDLRTSYDYWQFGVTATQLIYDFGQTSEKYSAAKLNADSQRLDRADHAAARSSSTCARPTSTRARTRSSSTSPRRRSTTRTSTSRRSRAWCTVGTQPPIALAQQKAAVANAVVQLITAQNNYETAKAQLNQAAGIAQGHRLRRRATRTPAPSADEDQPLETPRGEGHRGPPGDRDARASSARRRRRRWLGQGRLRALARRVGGRDRRRDRTSGQLVPNWNVGVRRSPGPSSRAGSPRAWSGRPRRGLDSVDAQKSLEELQVRLDVDSARLAVRAAKATIGAVDDALDERARAAAARRAALLDGRR